MTVIIIAPPCAYLQHFLKTLKEFIAVSQNGTAVLHTVAEERLAESFHVGIRTSHLLNVDELAYHYSTFLEGIVALNEHCVEDAASSMAAKKAHEIHVGCLDLASAKLVAKEAAGRKTVFVVLTQSVQDRVAQLEQICGGKIEVPETATEVIEKLDDVFQWDRKIEAWKPDLLTGGEDEFPVCRFYLSSEFSDQVKVASEVLAVLLSIT